MKSIDEIEKLWKRFCENPAKTAIYTVALIGISIFSVMALAYVNGYFTEMGRQTKAVVPASAGKASVAVTSPVSTTSTSISIKADPTQPSSLSDIQKLREIANKIPYGDKRTTQLLQITNTAIRSGNLEEALEVALDIPYDNIKGGALAKVSEAYALKGDFETAESVAEKITSSAAKNKALARIISLKR